MKSQKPNAYVELKQDSAGYWLVVESVPVFLGSVRPRSELLEVLTNHGPVMMTRETKRYSQPSS